LKKSDLFLSKYLLRLTTCKEEKDRLCSLTQEIIAIK
jgi:hypothetical protein